MRKVAERHRPVTEEPHVAHLFPASSRPLAFERSTRSGGVAFGAVDPRYRVMRCSIPSAVGRAAELQVQQTPLKTAEPRLSTRLGTLRRGPGSVNQSQGPGGAQRHYFLVQTSTNPRKPTLSGPTKARPAAPISTSLLAHAWIVFTKNSLWGGSGSPLGDVLRHRIPSSEAIIITKLRRFEWELGHYVTPQFNFRGRVRVIWVLRTYGVMY